jgi:hypothetical protein
VIFPFLRVGSRREAKDDVERRLVDDAKTAVDRASSRLLALVSRPPLVEMLPPYLLIRALRIHAKRLERCAEILSARVAPAEWRAAAPPPGVDCCGHRASEHDEEGRCHHADPGDGPCLCGRTIP